MKYLILNIWVCFLHATFLIVAVDTDTGEAGSAGGSCI
tara:strand:+ start:74 stop:187 length:114 start_codon:yes stop_codon:yes gene_type:complete